MLSWRTSLNIWECFGDVWLIRETEGLRKGGDGHWVRTVADHRRFTRSCRGCAKATLKRKVRSQEIRVSRGVSAPAQIQ